MNWKYQRQREKCKLYEVQITQGYSICRNPKMPKITNDLQDGYVCCADNCLEINPRIDRKTIIA